MNLTQEQKRTFADLQKPTMSLITSFYEMPVEIKSTFADIMAIYESNPTKENAKAIFDKIMGRDSAEDKKKWIEKTVSTVSLFTRSAAKKKYIDGQQAVPDGVPTSGMLLCGLDIVSRAEKDTLLEAQAAARLISHVDVLDKYEPKTNYQNADGSFENSFLDKPFATKIQRLEHLVNAVVNDVYTQNADKKDSAGSTREKCTENLFLQKAKHEAFCTLAQVAEKLKKTNPVASERISSYVKVADESVNAATIPLTKEDYTALEKEVAGRPVEGLVKHRVGQILTMDAMRQAALVKNYITR